MNEALQATLLELREEDLRVRAELSDAGELFGAYHSRMAEVHRKNAEKLERIVEEYGWPGVSLVGDEGAEAAWLVLQHAIGNPELQRRCLPILERSAETGEVPAAQVACLADRICVFEGRPQRFGTQFDWDGNGMLSPHPLQDADRVDEFRESVGLGTLAGKTREIRSRATAEGHIQPRDFRKYIEERENWARSAGWR